MTDEKPIEPSAVFTADGTRVPYRHGTALPATSGVSRPPLPALIRAATSGPLLTASVLAVAGVAAAKAAEAAGRIAWQATWAVVDGRRERRAVPVGLEISWTHIEIRWPT
ncbi:MAG: hypothetical protein M3Q47_18670 [Actinomycetota bacterium]|nr:hypothetical protein [Actinomycetota bacterium]